MRQLTRLELLEAADRGYPEGHLAKHYNAKNGTYHHCSHGKDTLAAIIVAKLNETFDEHASVEDQILQANKVLERAQLEIQSVRNALNKLLDPAYDK